MSDIRQTIARVRELDGKATKGPWAPDWGRVRDDNCGTICQHPSEESAFGPKWEANKDLIAEYRTAAPKLAAEYERLLEIIESAPHDESCGMVLNSHGYRGFSDKCDCWKSRAMAEMEDQTK